MRTDELTPSELGRALNALRKTRGAGTGRPKKIRKCKTCGQKFSARQMRAHKYSRGGEREGSIPSSKRLGHGP
jgi:hypothetical protein